MVYYYRRCIPNAAQLLSPLNSYLTQSKKNDRTKIHWTSQAEKAFEATKHTLASITNTPFLSPSAPLKLTTDTSSTVISASLEQLEDNIWKPIGFFSRKLIDTEQRYSTYDRRLLAIFASIKHFQHLLDCRLFVI